MLFHVKFAADAIDTEAEFVSLCWIVRNQLKTVVFGGYVETVVCALVGGEGWVNVLIISTVPRCCHHFKLAGRGAVLLGPPVVRYVFHTHRTALPTANTR